MYQHPFIPLPAPTIGLFVALTSANSSGIESDIRSDKDFLAGATSAGTMLASAKPPTMWVPISSVCTCLWRAQTPHSEGQSAVDEIMQYQLHLREIVRKSKEEMAYVTPTFIALSCLATSYTILNVGRMQQAGAPDPWGLHAARHWADVFQFTVTVSICSDAYPTRAQDWTNHVHCPLATLAPWTLASLDSSVASGSHRPCMWLINYNILSYIEKLWSQFTVIWRIIRISVLAPRSQDSLLTTGVE